MPLSESEGLLVWHRRIQETQWHCLAAPAVTGWQGDSCDRNKYDSSAAAASDASHCAYVTQKVKKKINAVLRFSFIWFLFYFAKITTVTQKTIFLKSTKNEMTLDLITNGWIWVYSFLIVA